MRTSVAHSAEAGSGGTAGPKVAAEAVYDTIKHRDRPIDLVHLARQTFGDKRLETELLRMFMRQADLIQTSLDDPAEHPRAQPAADLLHLLLGSSRVVGATRVAELAEALEAKLRRDGADPGADLPEADRAELRFAVASANGFIAGLLEPA